METKISCKSLPQYKALNTYSASDIDMEYIPPDEIVEDLITSGNLHIIYGASHSGKTFFALAMSAAVSIGDDFLGKKTEKGKVVYLATEAPRTIKERLQAIKKVFPHIDISNLEIVPEAINIYTNDDDVQSIITLCKEIGEVKLVVGDTLARMSAGANENSGEDMGPVMDRFESIGRETGAAVILIHHSGKDATRGLRGWSGISGHISGEIEITSVEKTGAKKARVTKQRELGTTGMELFFQLEAIEMGLGKFGSKRTSCIVRSTASVPKKQARNDAKEKALSMFSLAWEASSRKLFSDKPYLMREDFKQFLTNCNPNWSERTVTNKIDQTHTSSFIKPLLDNNLIQPLGSSGWILTNSDLIKSVSHEGEIEERKVS